MAILEIDGIGKVEVGSDFLSLPPARQAAEVDAIAASLRRPAPSPPLYGPGDVVLPAPVPSMGPTGIEGADASSRIGNAFLRGAKDALKFDESLGLSDETRKKARDAGMFRNPDDPMTLADPLRSLNETIMGGTAAVGDAALRGLAAPIFGFARAIGQTAREMGLSQGEADRLTRDVVGLVQAAGVVSGTGNPIKKPQAGAPAARGTAAEAPAVAAGEAPIASAAAAAPEAPPTPAAPAGAATARTAAVDTTKMTTPQIREASQSFYRQAEDAGVVIRSDAYGALVDDIAQTAKKARLDPDLTPDATAALKRLQDAKGAPVSFADLDTLRAIASDAQAAVKPQDRRIAGLMVDKVDDFIAKMDESKVMAGDARVAAETIVQARDLWSKAGKLDTIERLIDRAKTTAPNFSGSGMENALRTEFRALAKNEAKMRTFTGPEQKAIKLIARGTAGTNVARAVGKLAPTGLVSGALSGGMGATIGTSVLGPGIGSFAGAAAFYGAGASGRRLAAALIQRQIRSLEDLVRKGGDSEAVRSSLRRGLAALASLEAAAAATAAATAGTIAAYE